MTVIRRRMQVFTDGAFTGNTKVGGWAWAVASTPPGAGREGFGGVRGTTSQRMEMTAAYEAILAFEDWPIQIVSDSAYVVNCFEDRWYVDWRRRGWRTKSNHQVANQDIWKPLIEAALRNKTRFLKVKGHSGDPMNEYVDKLAVRAKKSIVVV